jgi:hypothetical protein
MFHVTLPVVQCTWQRRVSSGHQLGQRARLLEGKAVNFGKVGIAWEESKVLAWFYCRHRCVKDT